MTEFEEHLASLDKAIFGLESALKRGDDAAWLIEKFQELLEAFRKERLMLQTMSLPAKDLVPLSQVAKHVNVSVATVNRAARLEHLQAVKLGNYWYSTLAEGERWKAEDYRKHVSEKSEIPRVD